MIGNQPVYLFGVSVVELFTRHCTVVYSEQMGRRNMFSKRDFSATKIQFYFRKHPVYRRIVRNLSNSTTFDVTSLEFSTKSGLHNFPPAVIYALHYSRGTYN